MNIVARHRLLIGCVLVAALLLLSGACSDDQGQGPVAVKGDRDACEYCRMMISDLHFAAQVRLKPRERVHKFDDLGCALNWLNEQPGGIAGTAEIWVADYHDGHWLDARKAYYFTGKTTPMDYGLAAVAEPAPDSLSFSEAQQRVLAKQHRPHSSESSGHHPPPPTGSTGGGDRP